jgi:predicted nuclease with TOPRIM domain
MPLKIEHDGKEITVYLQEDLDKEVAGLKITNQSLKSEKDELKSKLNEQKDEARKAAEEKAKAEGDYEKLNQIMLEKQADESERYNKLIGQIKKEKTDNALNDIVTKVGAGGEKNEDLRDLLKSRYEFDYSQESGTVNVTGDGITSIEDLTKTVKESGRYDAYLAGNPASGSDAPGGKGSGVATKKFNEYTDNEKVALRRENPDEYARVLSEFNNTGN